MTILDSKIKHPEEYGNCHYTFKAPIMKEGTITECARCHTRLTMKNGQLRLDDYNGYEGSE